MAKIIKLETYRAAKSDALTGYRRRILGLDMQGLLAEMVVYQRERSTIGKLTPELIEKGLILFPLLSANAATLELKILAESYTRHLEYERSNA